MNQRMKEKTRSKPVYRKFIAQNKHANGEKIFIEKITAERKKRQSERLDGVHKTHIINIWNAYYLSISI